MFNNTDNNQFNLNKIQDDEMAVSEHIEEFSQRLIFCLLLLSSPLSSADVLFILFEILLKLVHCLVFDFVHGIIVFQHFNCIIAIL